jgi:hypothetical protein
VTTTHCLPGPRSGCDTDAINHACYGDYEHCFAVFDELCPSEVRHAGMNSCEACAFKKENTKKLEAANCTKFFMDYECGGGHDDNPWEEYIGALACHINGPCQLHD